MKFLRKLLNKTHGDDPITAEERFLMKKCIRDGDIVFDVGAHHGKWTEEVLKTCAANIHAFEASKDALSVLQNTLPYSVTLNWNAVTNHNEEVTFHVYRDDARLSSLHRRLSVEDRLLEAGYDEMRVPATTLDAYWAERTDQIRFLKIDVEGAEYDALRGAGKLLRSGRIDFLQFEYGGTFLDAGTTLRSVWSHLRRYGYRVLRVEGSRLTELENFKASNESYKYTNYLAVNARLMRVLTGKGGDIEIDFARMSHFGVQPTGALHVGAHKGDEIKAYRKRSITPVVFVEANPDLALALRKRFESEGDVTVIEAAASDRSGEATFHITSMDQSSSLLPLKDHAKLYPKIGVERQISVRTERLDTLLAEHGISTGDLNFIAMDIQGAELMALRGAEDLLPHISALQLEVNYKQLYEGCPLISDIDAYLDGFGFIRVMTNTPYDDSWGDALYVKKPMVTCSSVGSLGRFANHLFQYVFIQTYAAENAFEAANPPWAGDDIFCVKAGTTPLPNMPNAMAEEKFELHDSNVPNDPDVRPATDFTGFFQYHTRYYVPQKDLIRRQLTFKGPYAERAAEIKSLFQNQPGPVACAHLRRGDFGTGIFFAAPETWYVDWLQKLRETHPDLSVYIASDELDTVLPAFDGFNVLTARDLSETSLKHEFFTDFAALTLADHIAISNSSFSFSASMLNQTGTSFVRPDLTARRLVDFAPWNAPVLLRNVKAEDAGEEFMSARAKSRSKYKMKKLKKRLSGQ